MDSPEPNTPTPERLLGDLRQVIENAEELLKNTNQYSGPQHQNARSKLVSALNAATEELARFEDAQLERMIEATRAANKRCNDQSGEARLLRAFE